jgi:TPR repeat protein
VALILIIPRFLSRSVARWRPPTLERASRMFDRGRQAEAAADYRQLAIQGSELAQHRLAELYERGTGVLQNYVEAVRWYRAAAAQGNFAAMAQLGEIFMVGLTAPGIASPAALERLSEQHHAGGRS